MPGGRCGTEVLIVECLGEPDQQPCAAFNTGQWVLFGMLHSLGVLGKAIWFGCVLDQLLIFTQIIFSAIHPPLLLPYLAYFPVEHPHRRSLDC
jgi:hypothetical protein